MVRGHQLKLDCRIFSHCSAYYSGQYNCDKLSALLSFLRPGGNALDVGANIGFWAVPLALSVRQAGGKLVAVEPVASNVDWLKDNLELNDCSAAAIVLPIGLSDNNEESEIVLAEDYLTGAKVGNAVIAGSDYYGYQFSRTSIRLDTLDNIWPNIGGRLDIVKVDIEGYEHKFLEGGRGTIGQHRPVIVTEVNRTHYERQHLEFDTLIPSLLPQGYVFGETLPNGTISQIESLSDCKDTDVFLIPSERM
jgi:FkbM family methyltransferase